MINKYVNFVSDKEFLECVKWVCSAYPESDEVNMKSLQKNTIDPFKLIFDIINGTLEVDNWINTERIRQNDKTINNRIGEFHQKLLGKVKDWVDLGVGDSTKVDLKKEDNSIFIELKNKHNTMNSDATAQCHAKLKRSIKKYPNATSYWAYIISKKGASGEVVWRYRKKSNSKIKKIWGKKVYELITGDPNALENVWKALPIAINDFLNTTYQFSTQDKQKILKFFEAAFQN